jgi:hypothetical protein
METGWALRFRTSEEEGSPVQAWMFYVALVLFPLWWIAAFWRVPETRVVGGTDTEKAVPLDDPQIEFGELILSRAHTRVVYVCWRSLNVNRCALLALPLSRNGGYLVSHLHPVYRMRRDLRMRRHRPSATTAVIPPPRYLGLGDCEFLIIIFSYFSSSVYYRIRVFFMCVRASWC